MRFESRPRIRTFALTERSIVGAVPTQVFNRPQPIPTASVHAGLASRLSEPAPFAAKYRKMKQQRITNAPPLMIG